MTAGQVGLDGKVHRVDRHRIVQRGASCGVCGGVLEVVGFVAVMDLGNGPGAEVPVRFVRHARRRES